jgi:hypothetical protein
MLGSANAQRIGRYEKRETQCSQNKMLKEDTKKIYRNLGMKNIRGHRTSLYGRSRDLLKSLWGEKTQHNEREWIRRKQKRKNSHMDWKRVHV